MKAAILVSCFTTLKPNEGVQLPPGDVVFDCEKGTVEKYDEYGNVVEWVDLIDALANVPAIADR